jgi:hypothetical protein
MPTFREAVMTSSTRRWPACMFLCLVLAGLSRQQPQVAQAQTGERCFPETGFCVSGAIRTYWEQNGSLPVFGYPISAVSVEAVEDRTLAVQWFERDRLEVQTDGLVTAGRLGARWLELNGQRWEDLPHLTVPPDPGCRVFPETQHQVCEPFLRMWEAGGGLARFGYPITERRVEEIEGRVYTVQYFERRRMELHPEYAGTLDEVQLGLLGRAVLTYRPPCPAWFFQPAPELCPQGAPITREGASQRFERGVMLWFREPDVFVVFDDAGRYWFERAPYMFRTPPAVPREPPPGGLTPTGGFGALWRGAIAITDPAMAGISLSDALGWAVAPEERYATEIQCVRARASMEQRCYLRDPRGGVLWYGPAGAGRQP